MTCLSRIESDVDGFGGCVLKEKLEVYKVLLFYCGSQTRDVCAIKKGHAASSVYKEEVRDLLCGACIINDLHGHCC